MDSATPPVMMGVAGWVDPAVKPRVPKIEANGQGREEPLMGGGSVVWR